MKTIEKLVKDNLIRFIGVNNFNLKELEQGEQALENEHIACNQVLHNLGYRPIEKRIIQYYTKQEIAVVRYSHLDMVIFLLQIVLKEKCMPKLLIYID